MKTKRRRARWGGGWVQVRRGKNPRQGESLDKTKTKQTVQIRTSKIHKTRHQARGLLAIKYLHSSHILATIKISCAIHACWPRAAETLSTWSIAPHPSHRGGVGINHNLRHSIYTVLLPLKCLHRGHILATVKISYAIHTCKPCATYTLSTWYL